LSENIIDDSGTIIKNHGQNCLYQGVLLSEDGSVLLI